MPISAMLFLCALAAAAPVILAGCAPAPGPNAPDVFLIVSIDALRPDAVSPQTAPQITALASRGLSAEGRSVHPPKTLIAHTAMFTGLAPETSGRTDNSWEPGRPRVDVPTIFDTARREGLATGFFYAKGLLGYLVNGAVQRHALSADASIAAAVEFIRANDHAFVFLHISGLEYAGMRYGWMSPPYLAKLHAIDAQLGPLFATVTATGRFIVIVTSDHGGHARQHGTKHPDDYRVPLVVYSNHKPLPPVHDYRVTDLKRIIEKLL